MASFFYSEEENLYAQEARNFFEKEIGPHVESMDRKNEYPFDLLKRLARRRYLGIRFPARYGGGGKDMLHETIINEETGAQSYALACARSVPHHVMDIIHQYGSEEQKQQYLPGICQAEIIVSECITEPETGSDTARIQTQATRDGDHYVINGEKRFMASGGVADLFLVFAITKPDVHPTQGMSIFIVPKGDPGIATFEEFETLGWRGLRIVSQIVFHQVRVPATGLVGRENQGFPMLMEMLNAERIVVAAGLIGPARSCYEMAVRYSMQRQAFHRPIRQFEAISFKVSDMATKIEAARLLRIQAARMLDRGFNVTKEAAIAKLFSAEAAFWVVSEAMQIMGGIGYTTKFPIERHFRDVRGGMIAVGTSEIMRLVIQREVYHEFSKEEPK
jgi:alkylation response protein AidB-like acyl-CoA dehydrogenase